MKIYVVEQMYDYVTQIGWSTSREVAEQMCQKYTKELKRKCWVKTYALNKKLWSEFDCD